MYTWAIWEDEESRLEDINQLNAVQEAMVDVRYQHHDSYVHPTKQWIADCQLEPLRHLTSLVEIQETSLWSWLRASNDDSTWGDVYFV